MFDLSQFGLSEAMLVGATLRRLGKGSASLEAASQRIAQFFCDQFTDGATGKSSFVLARCYETFSLRALPSDVARFARSIFPNQSLDDGTQCLTLLGTFGDERSWQDRKSSHGHQAIPLANDKTLTALPMVARLTEALGLHAAEMVRPDPAFLIEKDREGFNVFHVEEALGSPYIPAQERFVQGFGVRSVVGFGFVMPPAHVFATILFARQHISAETAELFKTLALSLKLALLPLAGQKIFDEV